MYSKIKFTNAQWISALICLAAFAMPIASFAQAAGSSGSSWGSGITTWLQGVVTLIFVTWGPLIAVIGLAVDILGWWFERISIGTAIKAGVLIAAFFAVPSIISGISGQTVNVQG